jgi:hypothetical protein
MKNAVFWDMTQFLVTANVFPNSLIISIVMMEAVRSSETLGPSVQY